MLLVNFILFNEMYLYHLKYNYLNLSSNYWNVNLC